MKEIRKSLFLFIILFFEVNTFGQAIVPLPNWDFYIGDSVIASSNVEVQNVSKPIIYYTLNDSNKLLKCILRAYSRNVENYNLITRFEILFNDEVVIKDAFWGYKQEKKDINEIQFILKNDRIKNELKNYIGEKLKITFQDEAFQKTPTVLGYLVVQEK